ncbi:S-methyl-5'-thioinosine phosphorylase [Usitatibacter palustris]|uniref:Probable S-methyl-5'-thioinosine phosphorylase n=1 Tax=Usitatibacter palustris TaxID=2732487 RepID=A0A6M4H3I2_9PROT|nr:S-methyl-5'-thioinosine phosphorylase [Usitatibacter palustris]QJR14139.1 S-methyl-5'-thioinosine phosphorylase [Usitatibacter palustris]
MIAIIGGSGLTQLENLAITAKQIVRTPYGEPSGPITFGRIGAVDVAFLARHGYGHTLAPHEINYRANLWALHSKGVKRVIAVCTVGGIHAQLGAGAIAVPDQIIDYTWGRKSTYFEGSEQPVTHVDFTTPFCETTRQMVIAGAKDAGVALVAGGTYGATQGPRLETKAEIDRLERDGATMVGMTVMPEAALARELSISYAALAVVVNPAAGRGTSAKGIDMDDIARIIETTMAKVRLVVAKAVELHVRS